MTVATHDTIAPHTEESREATVRQAVQRAADRANAADDIDRTDHEVRKPDHLDGDALHAGRWRIAYVPTSGDGIQAGEEAHEHREALRLLADELDVEVVDCPHCEGSGGTTERKRSGRIGQKHVPVECDRCDGGRLVG